MACQSLLHVAHLQSARRFSLLFGVPLGFHALPLLTVWEESQYARSGTFSLTGYQTMSRVTPNMVSVVPVIVYISPHVRWGLELSGPYKGKQGITTNKIQSWTCSLFGWILSLKPLVYSRNNSNSEAGNIKINSSLWYSITYLNWMHQFKCMASTIVHGREPSTTCLNGLRLSNKSSRHLLC